MTVALAGGCGVVAVAVALTAAVTAFGVGMSLASCVINRQPLAISNHSYDMSHSREP